MPRRRLSPSVKVAGVSVASTGLAAGIFAGGPGVSTVILLFRHGGIHDVLLGDGMRYSMASLVPKVGSPGGVGTLTGGGSIGFIGYASHRQAARSASPEDELES
jgi:hypothetical protein